MSRFYLGQRVRVVAHDISDARPIGREGFVNEIDAKDVRGLLGIGVTIPGLCPLSDTDYIYCDEEWCFCEDELVPIIPPGLESIEEALALWLPEEEHA